MPQADLKDYPNDQEAEKAVLGAMISSSDAIAEALDILKPKHFFYGAHILLADLIIELYSNSIPIDPITLLDAIDKKNIADKTGGAVYITKLINSVSTTSNVSHWAKLVKEKYIQRELIKSGAFISQLGNLAEASDAYDALNKAQERLLSLANEDDAVDVIPMLEGVRSLLKDIDKKKENKGVLGVPSGFQDLDKVIFGFSEGQLIVIGARPTVGKTAIALDMARHGSIRGNFPTLFISLEMGRDEIFTRILASEASINQGKFLQPQFMNASDWSKLEKTRSLIERSPLYIYSPPGITIAQIRAKARQLLHKSGLKLLVIDYLGLIQASDPTLPRVQQITDMTRSLKTLAQELNIPILLLSQLNRESDKRANFGEKKSAQPKMSELRESGSIEQDADVVLLLHRPNDADSEANTLSNEAKLIVAKNRRGQQGNMITLNFQGEYVRFVPVAREQTPADI